MKKGDIDYVLYGHTDTITGVALSSEGSYLLSNSMDDTIRCWDVKSFVIGNRCIKIFQGNSHGHDKNLLKVAWSSDGLMITAGSADRYWTPIIADILDMYIFGIQHQEKFCIN